MILTKLEKINLGSSPLIVIAGQSNFEIPLFVFEAIGFKIPKRKLFVGTAHPSYLDTATTTFENQDINIYDAGGVLKTGIIDLEPSPHSLSSVYTAAAYAHILIFIPTPNNPMPSLIAEMAFRSGCQNFIAIADKMSLAEVQHLLKTISPTLESVPILDKNNLNSKLKLDFKLEFASLISRSLKHFNLVNGSTAEKTIYSVSSLTTQGIYKGMYRARGLLKRGKLQLGMKLNAVSHERTWPAEIIEINDQPGDHWIIFRSDCSNEVQLLSGSGDTSIEKEAKSQGISGLQGAAELYQQKSNWCRCYAGNGKIEYRFVAELGSMSAKDPRPGFFHQKGQPLLLAFRNGTPFPKFVFSLWT